MNNDRVCLLFLLISFVLPAQNTVVPLTVPAGAPLRLYVTQRVPMRISAPASAKLIEPIYAFDRVVIPAGSEVQGRVTQLDPVSKLVRAHALLGGDFTPLHRARVEFSELRLPGRRMLNLQTIGSAGLSTIYEEPKPQKPKAAKKPQASKPHSEVRTVIEQEAKKQINAKIDATLNSRTYGLGSLVRGPNKKERLIAFAWSKLPYHPQYYRRGTRFDSVLRAPVDFGSAALEADALNQVGAPIPIDSAVSVRFLSTVSSASANVGDPVQAVLSEPLRDPANKLLLPEGTHLAGIVRQTQHARWLHRGGKLRFTFDQVTLPPFLELATRTPPPRAEARLLTAETDPRASVKIDSEGGAKSSEPKTRLIAPAISALIAVKSLDNDTGKYAHGGGNGSNNAGGSALGGFSGFGLLGVAAGHASYVAGAALGWWGMAVSAYSAIFSPGQDVEFTENSSLAVRFGTRPTAAESASAAKP